MNVDHLREKARNAATKLERDAVHVWLGESIAVGDFYVLSDEERERASRYRFRRHRLTFVAGRSATRAVLAGYLDCACRDIHFEYGFHGKPKISKPSTSLTFNLSHSGGRLLIAIAYEHELGVDVEACRNAFRFTDAIRGNLNDIERSKIDHTPLKLREDLLLRYWTQKEACLKALGVGLSTSPTLLHVEFEEHGRVKIKNGRFYGQDYLYGYNIDCGPSYKGALVVASEVTHSIYEI